MKKKTIVILSAFLLVLLLAVTGSLLFTMAQPAEDSLERMLDISFGDVSEITLHYVDGEKTLDSHQTRAFLKILRGLRLQEDKDYLPREGGKGILPFCLKTDGKALYFTFFSDEALQIGNCFYTFKKPVSLDPFL